MARESTKQEFYFPRGRMKPELSGLAGSLSPPKMFPSTGEAYAAM